MSYKWLVLVLLCTLVTLAVTDDDFDEAYLQDLIGEEPIDIRPKASNKPATNSNAVFTSKTLNIKRCKHGTFMFNPLDNTHGRAMNEYGQYSEGEIDIFRQLLRPGDVVVEAGANIGMFTVFMAQQVQHGVVHAFEPLRPIYQQLMGNLALNGLDNVHAHLAALGDRSGTLRVPNVNYERDGCHGCTMLDPASYQKGGVLDVDLGRVRVTTVDHLKLAALRLLKVDVNGMELEVINGSRKTIQQHKPIVFISNRRDSRSLELVRLLDELGYDMHWSVSVCKSEDNFFNNHNDVFSRYCAHVNMICTHRESDVNIVGDTEKIPVPALTQTNPRAHYGPAFDMIDSRGDGLGMDDNLDYSLQNTFGSVSDDDDLDELLGTVTNRQPASPQPAHKSAKPTQQQPPMAQQQQQQQKSQARQQQQEEKSTKSAKKPARKFAKSKSEDDNEPEPVPTPSPTPTPAAKPASATTRKPPQQQQQQRPPPSTQKKAQRPAAAPSKLDIDALLGDDDNEDIDAILASITGSL